MTLSKEMLIKLNKDDLINLVLQLQNRSEKMESPTKLRFKRNFKNYSAYADGNKMYGITVEMKDSTLYCICEKYTPSGYSDNGIREEFHLKLTPANINKISKHGFTHNIILPIIEKEIYKRTGKLNDNSGPLMK